MSGNEKHFHTKPIIEEKKNLIKNKNDKAITPYIDILPWKPKPGKPTFLEHSSLLLYYSI
jgi:hypothetical protein